MIDQTLQEEINRMIATIYNGNGQQDTPPLDTELPQVTNEYDVYVEADRLTFVKREDPGVADDTTPQVTIVSAPVEPGDEKPLLDQRTSTQLAYATILFSLFLILFSLMVQLQVSLNPPTALIIIIPKSQTLTLSGTVQMGRVLTPITLSQQQTVRTTGHGHQDAKLAKGFITFYNGQLAQQFVFAGTILIGSDGVMIETTQDSIIPAADTTTTPPTFGHVTVSAQAVNEGAAGNIAAYDISQPFYSVIAKNTTAFTGGQDERDFPIVTKADINKVATPLKNALIKSMSGSLAGQAASGEVLQMLPCSPTTTTNHAPGDEATQVTVTILLTCSAVAYNEHALEAKVTQLQTIQAVRKFGAGYTLADLHVEVTHTTITQHNTCVLIFSSIGTWVYALNSHEQEHIKALVSGKSKTTALQMLRGLPGIASASIEGVDQNTPLPKSRTNIHIIIIFTV